MKPNQSKQVKPINRVRLFLFSAAVVPIYMALALAFVTGTMFYIFRAQTQVVRMDTDNAAGQWSRIESPPGIPDQLETDADGSLWTSTRLKDSISRFRDGQWEVFRGDIFGTAKHAPYHDFVVVENRVWAVIEDDLVEFDGQSWKKHAIPNPAGDHVLAANREAVWLLGNDGILRTFDGQNWDSTEPQSTIEALCWDAESRFLAPDFLADDDGDLWVCSGQLWRWKDKDWKQVPFQDQMLTDAGLRGYADEKIWLDDPRGLLWIGQDTQTEGLFTREQLGLLGHEHIHGVYRLDEQTWLKASFVRNVKCFACFSVTDDLTYLETGNLALPRDPKKQDKENFILQSLPSATAAAILDAHRGRLNELADLRQTRPIALVKDDLEQVAHYGQKLLYDELKDRRMVMANPYEDTPCDFANRHPQEDTPCEFAPNETGSAAPLPPLGTIDGFNFPTQVG